MKNTCEERERRKNWIPEKVEKPEKNIYNGTKVITRLRVNGHASSSGEVVLSFRTSSYNIYQVHNLSLAC